MRSPNLALPADSKPQPALLPEIAGPALVAPATPQLDAALDRAFAEPEAPPFRHTKAVVVVKDGHIIAERYADGYGIDTPVLGFSATKSVISALTGILVRKGKLALDRAGAGRGVAKRRRSRGTRSRVDQSAAPYRGPCDRQLAAGLARRRAGAGQPHEVHGIATWPPMPKASGLRRRPAAPGIT